MCLSAYLPRVRSIQLSEVATKIPTLICHGDEDGVVVPEYGHKAAGQLSAAGVPVEFKIYPGMDHSACDEEIEDIIAFMSQHVPELTEKE